MTLADIRDYVESLQIADTVYMGKLDGKPERSLGVYRSKHQYAQQPIAIGGPSLSSYGTYHATILVHWNRSPRETEAAAEQLYDALRAAREADINSERIKFILLPYDIQDVGTDEAGIFEMVIEAAFIYAKGASE